ncbi:CPBP family intramembrane glutamic endopeptidase [Kribbella sp. NPDC056951]|uniref:CPBP family intramembrane glutamic endopeptidase n=1 Tax=Kribbella sp. NPDC056951 TaxID=3345978 RepID=UPI0036451F71
MHPHSGEPRPEDSPQAPPGQYPPPPAQQPYPGYPPQQPPPPYPLQPNHPPAQGHPQHPQNYPQQQGYPPPPQNYPPAPGYPPPGYPMGQQQPWPQQYPRVKEPRVIPAPAGTPFHRLARTPKHAAWRPVVGSLALGGWVFAASLVVFLAWLVIHLILGGEMPSFEGTGAEIFGNTNEDLALNLVLLGVLTPFVALTAWMIQRRPAWSVASVLNKIRWGWLAWCCLPAVAYVVAGTGFGLLVDQIVPPDEAVVDTGAWVGFAKFVVPLILIVLLVPFQAAAEEFIFRGWLIQAVGAYGPDSVEGRARWARVLFRTPWPGIVISAIAFASAHGYTGWAMADILLFAGVAGWLTVRTGGIEAAIALHVLNNLFAFLLPAATGGLDDWSEQGGAPWTILLGDVPALAIVVFSVVWLAKRKQIARVS